MEELIQKASQGDAKAMLELGNRYYLGNGVERHLTNAISWWKSAADCDIPDIAREASQCLVQYYLENENFIEAEKWASKEMELGSSVGLFQLAIALCEKERIGGLNILMDLAKKGDSNALNAFPQYAHKMMEVGTELTPEMKEFVNTTYSSEYVMPSDATNSSPSLWTKIKTYLALAIVAIIAIWFLWITITPTVVVIEKGNVHRTENVIGSLKVLNPQGEEIELKGLKLFTRYVYNGTNSTLVCYNVLYSNDEAAGKKFKEEYYLINSNVAKVVDELPDFYFEEPESIEVSEHWLISIFNSIFGSSEVKWVIDEYVSDSEIGTLPTNTILEIAQSGNGVAQYYASLRYLSGNDIPADTIKAFEWMQKSALQGCVEGELGLGVMYSYGLGTTEDLEQAYKFIKLASDKNNAEAHWYLAMFYYNGLYVEKNFDKYRELIEFSARGGFVDGQTELALNLLEEGNPDLAIEWLDKAFEQAPNTEHISAAGFMLINMGNDENIEQGYRYLQYAAEQGDEEAIDALKRYPTIDSLKKRH